MGIWQAIRGVFRRGGGDEGFVPAAKQPSVVAKRFVLLVLVAELADSVAVEAAGAREDGRAMRTRALDQLLGVGFTPGDLEASERSFVMSLRTGKIAPNDAMAAAQRLECAGVLAWALELEPAILPVDRSAELASLRSRLPLDTAGWQAFSGAVSVRPLPELLAARHEWSTRWFELEVRPASDERQRVADRARAIRWLTEPELVELSATKV
ncbi:MAG TPA: DUF4272 domain-containing protein [Kofleriaceae bacterium]|jgi:hypothetical protein